MRGPDPYHTLVEEPFHPIPRSPVSQSRVPRLHQRRDRRHHRLELATALYGADPQRALVVPELNAILSVTEADRSAIVWVDEYGAAVPHIYAVLDVGNERPRRSFSYEVFRDAWELGVPGLVDFVGRNAIREGPEALAVLAIGSDGTRAWFVIADGRTPRPPLSPTERGVLMNLGGRCSGIVLHRDLDARKNKAGMPGREREPLPGWPILKDLDEHRGSAVERRISLRFVVARLISITVDEDLVPTAELPDAVETARAEIGEEFPEDPERALWEAVLTCLVSGGLPALGDETLALAHHAATMDHRWGAAELCRCAYAIAVGTGSGPTARDAASLMARQCQRLSDNRSAARWKRVVGSVDLALDHLQAPADPELDSD